MILTALTTLGGLGFLFSIILAIAYTKLAIKKSEVEEKILSCLPGANCGACGFPGCEGYAVALAKNEVEIGSCPICDADSLKKLSEILGVNVSRLVGSDPKVASILCQGNSNHTSKRFDYIGVNTCGGAKVFFFGGNSCIYGCLGFGDCVNVCKFDAIKMDGLPIIDEEKCTGCGKCVEICPQNILTLLSKEQKVFVSCKSPEPLKIKKNNCKIGCIGCGLCVKNCPYNAIIVEDGVAKINFNLCENCGICVYKCPTKSIVDKLKARPKAIIGLECDGCDRCKEVCVMKAIEGNKRERHRVILEKCVGCGLCYKVCEKKAITIAFSLGYAKEAV